MRCACNGSYIGTRAWTVAAGVPMYVGLFGRDTLMAGWQAALVGSEVLRGTLPRLAALQGTRNDPWRDEQPGRVLHEAHEGPLAALQLHPKGRYYGSLTSSALFPFCIAQLWAWTADREAVAPLVDAGRAALAWLDRVACDPRGFYAYRTRSKQGLDNQTWKDSHDGVPDEHGRTVPQPVASCEEQATVFAAKVAFAEVLWAFGHKAEARRLHREALALRTRFNDAYWMDGAGFFAMALDPRGRQVRSIGSNALHCLASGIADETLAQRVIERLFAPDLFSGWGVRTLSTQHPAYNPYAYHRGAVWPVEQGPLALAACRGGWYERVQEIARAVFDAASIFDSNRLPECFSGHPRDAAHPFPSLYPAANAPQAWSATTPISLVQALLGLQPYAPAGLLLVDPHLPEWLPRLCLHGLRVGGAVVDLEFLRTPDGDTEFRILHQTGPLQVRRQAASWALAREFGNGLRALLGV
jgi:glycogen debranching enzyme